MSWEHYAEHKCGAIIRVPFGNTSFITNFGQLCECGEMLESRDIEKFIGRYVWAGNIFNPLTWFTWRLERKTK